MKTNTVIHQMFKTGALLVLAALCITALAVPAEAQQYTSVRAGGRAGSWDFFLPLTYAESASIDGQGGSHVNIDSAWGLGFGFGYNLTDRFELGGLWAWNSRTYYADVASVGGGTRRYSNWMNTSTLQLNGTFYILDGKISPFVTGGVGIVYIDTNIPTGFSGPSTCWYDPWFGYICDSYTPTKTENDLTYNVGIGVRFDLDRSFALQAGYYKSWIDFSNASGDPDFNTWKLDMVFRMW